MNNLVIMHDQQAVTTSLILAEAFKKEHRNVIRTIETKIGELNFEQSLKMFSKGEYTNTQKLYEAVTERYGDSVEDNLKGAIRFIRVWKEWLKMDNLALFLSIVALVSAILGMFQNK